MKINRKRILIGISVFLVLALTAQLVRMQLGLANYGQEFGTYGQYNRVVRLIKERENYKIVDHGLSRDLEWDSLDHLNRFYITLKDTGNKEYTIEFLEGSEEMEETDEAILNQIIDAKISEQGASQKNETTH